MKPFTELDRRQFHAAVQKNVALYWSSVPQEEVDAALGKQSAIHSHGDLRKQCDLFLGSNAASLHEVMGPGYKLDDVAVDFVFSRNSPAYPGLSDIPWGFEKLKSQTGKDLHRSAVEFGIAVLDEVALEATPVRPSVR